MGRRKPRAGLPRVDVRRKGTAVHTNMVSLFSVLMTICQVDLQISRYQNVSILGFIGAKDDHNNNNNNNQISIEPYASYRGAVA